ncbi:hypothetical protein CFN78_02350 [Amycolatopsis antarctica]|uniref:Uncharacterized protein n=1 Tax=Amycolatopsis antarctica TaxID=1854586 RepID=A0A263D9B0_9PSEU|nr:hypothetical protein CFN78_02350 [Amycolatopsis antarctica]
MREIHAVPAYFPDWADGPSLSWCLRWRPDPLTPRRLDHLLVTDLGLLDLPPRLTGTHAGLRRGATRHPVAGTGVWICDPAEVLGRLDGSARRKDAARAEEYAALRARAPLAPTPEGLARLGSLNR